MDLHQHQCIFLDRDGVLNKERGDYSYDLSHFEIIPGIPKLLKTLKERGFLLVVITNQGGIARKIFSRRQMYACHAHLQEACNHIIDAIYYSPYHPLVTNSLSRKPDSLLFEKAIAKFHINPSRSWMVGDHERDIIPAKKLGIQTIRLSKEEEVSIADHITDSLEEAVQLILK